MVRTSELNYENNSLGQTLLWNARYETGASHTEGATRETTATKVPDSPFSYVITILCNEAENEARFTALL
jgi:hypothetical protein